MEKQNKKEKEKKIKTAEQKKEDNLKYIKKYYEKHPNKLTEWIECECGCFYKYVTKSNHLKSKRHCLVMKALKKVEEQQLKQEDSGESDKTMIIHSDDGLTK